MRTLIEVVETKTGTVVHSMDVTKKTPAQRERVERGLLINMDRERFHTRIVQRGEPEPRKP